jgi:uncharacterized protein with HEPN domain
MNAEDLTRLRHMRDAARDAVSFVQDRSRADLSDDRQLALALLKCVEIIGEAASQVSPAARAEMTDLPWHEMVGMRHHLVHAYYDVNLDVVWATVCEDLPPLLEALERALAEA